MRTRTKRLLIATPIVLVGALGLVAALTAVRAAGFPRHWRELAEAPPPADAVRVLALGDSAMVAVGAFDPSHGIAARIAADATAATGRPVHLVNRSRGGATVADVLARQADPGEIARADLIVVQTSNDAEQRVPLERYRSELGRLLELLPADRTVIGDVPLIPGREPYQQVLDELTNEHGVRLARSSEVFRHEGRRLDVFSALPPHLNDRGYGYWASAFLPLTRQVLS